MTHPNQSELEQHTPLPEQGGFNEKLDSAFRAYLGGTPDEDELEDWDEFKQSIRTLILEEIIGGSQPMPNRGEVDPDIHIEVIHRVEGRNALRAEQRNKLKERDDE